jgi:exonuclease SbcC
MSIADIFKRWLGLSDKKPQTTPPARPAPARPQPVKNAPPSARDAAENREAQQRAAVNSSNNIGQLIQKHRMSGAAGRKAIEQRLGELLVVNTADKDFFRKQDIDQLQALALFGASPEIREQALERIEDQNVLAQIVSENSSSRIRQLAAAKITDESLLNFAGEAIRHKDKGLYKQIRHRLDSTHAESKAREDRQKLLEKLCHDMEVQSRQAVSPLYAAKLLNLEQQWKEASSHPDANLSPALQQRFEAATQSARFALAESTRASEAEMTARQEQQDVTEALHQRLEALTAASDWVGHAVFLQALSQLEGRWGITLTAASPDNGLRHRFEALQKEARQLHRLLEQAEPAVAEIQALLNPSEGDAPDAGGLSRLHELLKPLSLNRHGRIPLLLKQAQSLVEQAQLHAPKKKTSARVEKARKPPKETPPELLDMLERLAAMVQEGHVLDAEKLLKEALALAKGQKIKNARLNELADEVYKLKDWAKFAILPKKEAMVARMTTLAEEALGDPEARMEAIKSLQAEWNALGKMNTEAERQLWKQFQDLGQKAWEPVKQFLDEQRAREDANAARREALCAELEEYQANMPADVNWQRHITILRTAREEWQRHHPVSSKVHKALASAFFECNQCIGSASAYGI